MQANILVAVDNILVRYNDSKIEILMLEINKGEYKGSWCLPGGLINKEEDPKDSARRIAKEKLGVTEINPIQLYTFGDPDRDVRGRSISIVYYHLIPPNTKMPVSLEDHYSNHKWFSLDTLPGDTAFDHREILKFFLDHLKKSIYNISLIRPLLPEEFTLEELRNVFVVATKEDIDKRNFNKKIKNFTDIVKTDNYTKMRVGRPAVLYKFEDE